MLNWVVTLIVLGTAGCASTQRNGVCPPRAIVEMCSPGFELACETTEDGCEQCSCTPIADEQGRPYHGPLPR